MPRAGRKERLERKAVLNAYISDVTVNDYANADVKGGTTLRVKKAAKGPGGNIKRALIAQKIRKSKIEAAATAAAAAAVKEGADDVEGAAAAVTAAAVEEEELNWFEKDLDDFHLDSEEDEEKPEDQDEKPTGHGEVEEELTKSRRRRRKTKSLSEEVEKGIIYPYDLWYQLSTYIHPDDVGRFAATCRTACYLVYTSAFWRNMYLRFYKKKNQLPEELRPCNIERVRGLRARVIRSLFYLYRPLADRTVTLVPFENEPHQLQSQRCLLTWHQPVKNMWNFCFKFSRGQQTTRPFLPLRVSSKYDMLPGYNDLFYNPEDGCRILQVTVQNFISIPMVMGMVLSKVYLTVSSQMRYYRLRLLFDTTLQDGNSNSAEVVVDLDPVVNIRVLPWWEPKYPFTF